MISLSTLPCRRKSPRSGLGIHLLTLVASRAPCAALTICSVFALTGWGKIAVGNDRSSGTGGRFGRSETGRNSAALARTRFISSATSIWELFVSGMRGWKRLAFALEHGGERAAKFDTIFR